jgi:hypothetical protein
MKLAFAVTTSLVAASAGHALAAPAAWCGEGVMEQFNVTEPDGRFKYNTDADDLADERALDAIAGASCSTMMNGDQQRYHAQIEAARARWSKRLHMTEADWADAGEWIRENTSMRYFDGVAMKLDDRATYSDLGPLAQFIVLGIHGPEHPKWTMPDYEADALGPRLTQAGLVGYVSQCLRNAPGGGIDAPRWATCWHDAEAIDLDKLNAEIHASKEGANGIDRMRLRINAFQLVAQKLPEARKRLADAEKRDDSIAKLFEVAANARKAWRDQAPSLQGALALQDKLDDAALKNSRNAHLDDCAKLARDEFDAVVKATPVAKFGDLGLKKRKDGEITPAYERAVAAVMSTPAGYLAATAINACASLTNRPVQLAAALNPRGVAYRGERTAAMTAMMLSGIQPDDRGKTFEYSAADAPAWTSDGTENVGGRGKLSKVTKVGDHVHLVFTAKMEKETYCDNYRETSHILGIDSNGTFRYEMVCTAYKTEIVNKASEPFDVDLADGGALKAGMYIAYASGVMFAWNKPGDKTPVLVFGIAVK